MKTLLICGITGRMGGETARLAPAYGFAPRAFAPEIREGVIVDFSHPDALPVLLESGLPLVIGTTGHSAAQQAAIRESARKRPVFVASNFSPGVHALRQAARLVKELLPGWEITLVERHHAQKQDAPGGTARELARDAGLPADRVFSLRAGTVSGLHELTFYGPEEALTLLHLAESRAVFAHGALRAARWLDRRPPGLYGMDDLLDVRKS